MNTKRNIFIFAHQDDETGVFWEIKNLITHGEDVIIIYLTSGDLSGNHSSIRNNESISILLKLGLPRENIYFLGTEHQIPDGKLSQFLEIAYQSIIDLITKTCAPTRLYFLAWEGGHQDHDSVHLIGTAIGKKLGIIENCFQFPLYTGHNLPSIIFKLFSPLSDNGKASLSIIPWRERLLFIKYCLSYPSQIKTWIGLFPFFLFHYIFNGTQILQPVSYQRIKQQPHSGTLLYERRGIYNYKQFLNDSDNFIQQHLNSLNITDK